MTTPRMTTVELVDLSPREAVYALLRRGPCSARQLADRLLVNGYRWTHGDPPTRQRVYEKLRELEDAGRVTKHPNPYDNGYVWRAR